MNRSIEAEKYERNIMEEVEEYLDSPGFKQACNEMSSSAKEGFLESEVYTIDFDLGVRLRIYYGRKDGIYQVVNVEDINGNKFPYWTGCKNVTSITYNGKDWLIHKEGQDLWLTEGALL